MGNMSKFRLSLTFNRSVTTVTVLLCTFILSLTAPVFAQDIAQDIAQDQTVRNTNSLGTDLWKAVRQNNLPQQSQVDSGGAGAIYTDGMRWLTFRDQQLLPYIAYAIGATLIAIMLFWLIRRSIKIPGGDSGNLLQRTSVYERFIHWSMAITFILLAITGFVLMYGRSLLAPMMGAEAYGFFGGISNTVHYLLGFIFPITIILMFFKFVGRNLYAKGDFNWLFKGGGFLSDAHVSAGFFNMGEKILFWLVMLFGVLLSASGLIMEFQLIELSRTELMMANSVHGIVAAVFVMLVFGHIYLSTLGVKGTLSGMTKGTVDENWAKAHHDRWYEQLKTK